MRTTPPRVPRRLGLLLLAASVLLTTGCRLRAELNLTVEEDGSGVVEFAVALDDEAIERRPDLADDLAVDDLVAAGWVVTGPAEEADGDTWIRARHAFGRPEELALLVAEVAGPDGPFRDFAVVRDDAFAETTYRFEGTVDFTAGLDDVTADPELAEALDAEPLELIEERLGAAIDELISVQVAVRLPGSVDSNAPTRASNGAVWQPSVLEREALTLRATGTVTRTERWAWVGGAALAGTALVLFLAIRLVLWRRRHADDATAGSAGGGS